MISAASLPALLPFDGTALGCRILAAAAVYGVKDPDMPIWTGDRFALLQTGPTLLLAGRASDPEELESFVRFSGAQTLVCNAASALLGFPVVETGAAMRLERPPETDLPDGCVFRLLDGTPRPEDPRLTDFYALLADCTDPALHFAAPPFADFYTDTHLRIRRKSRVAACLLRSGRVDACVLADLSPNCAFLFSGAVRPDLRGHRAFAAMLTALLPHLHGRRVFLFCVEALCSHYAAMGFARTGSFALQTTCQEGNANGKY